MRQDISENKQLLTLRATIIIVAAYLAFDMVKNYVVGNLSDTHFSEIIYYEFSDIYDKCFPDTKPQTIKIKKKK